MTEKQIKIGTPVIYWSIIKKSGERFDPIKTVIESDVWKLGHGLAVCKVKGVSGGVSIKHLQLETPVSLAIAQTHGMKDFTLNQ